MAGAGHNSGEVGGIAADQLRTIVARIERLNEEKDELAADIREVFAEAKGNGFDAKVIREIIKMRKQDEPKRTEFEALVDLYKMAMGMD